MPPIPSHTPENVNIQMEPLTTPKKKSGGAGATVGIIIIFILMIFGALYFWGASLNANKDQEPLPLILGDPTVAL